MRCPHCAGEIQDGSLFCGICGKPTDGAAASASRGAGASQSRDRTSGTRHPASTSPSLFELPVSKGARVARIAIVLALDALLLIAGIAMIVSYLNDRDRASSRKKSPPAADKLADNQAGSVRFAEPVPLHKKRTHVAKARTRAGARKATSKRRATKRRGSRTTKPAAAAGKDKPKPKPKDKPDDKVVSKPGPMDAGVVTSAGEADAGASSSAVDVDAGVDPDAPSDADVAILARQIRLVVNRERRLLQRCYNQVAKATTVDKALQGRVEIRFEVMPDGKTRNVSPRGNTTGSTQLAQCVSNLIRNWKFPSHPGKRGVPFVWPFDFRGS